MSYNPLCISDSVQVYEREGAVEDEQVVMEELAKIRRMVRQIWIMMIIVIAFVAVPVFLFGCSVIGVILFEFLPH